MAEEIIRNCRNEDLPQLLKLWQSAGLTLGKSDTFVELKKFISYNSDACLVLELKGAIIGSVFGGFDGRRGLVHHLTVAEEYQGRGYGSRLMKELDRRFAEKGIVKYHLWIEEADEKLINFYRNLGFELRSLITMTKTLK